jgi:hypothetical protein
LKPKSDKKSEEPNQNVLVTTYHPNDRILPEIVHANWDLLGKGLTTSFLHKSRPLVAYRRPPNLRDILVRADISLSKKIKKQLDTTETTVDQKDPNQNIFKRKLRQTSITSFLKPKNSGTNLEPEIGKKNTVTTDVDTKPVTYKKRNFCSNPKCRICPLIDKSGEIECHLTGQKYLCKENVCCQSSNIIYGITCKRCGKQYVGQTKRPLYARMLEHLRSIKNIIQPTNAIYKPQPVGLHFSAKDHIGQRDVKVQILDFIHFHPDSKKAEEVRLRVEKKWIHRLRCPAPHGMNIFD